MGLMKPSFVRFEMFLALEAFVWTVSQKFRNNSSAWQRGWPVLRSLGLQEDEDDEGRQDYKGRRSIVDWSEGYDEVDLLDLMA